MTHVFLAKIEIFGFFIAVVFLGVSRHAVYLQGAVRYVAFQKVWRFSKLKMQ